MKRLVLATVASWFGLVSFAGSTHAASHQAIRSVPRQGATLYNAAFKTNGLKGWTVPVAAGLRSDWSVNRNGVVRSQAMSSELLAPFRLGGTRNFAVEATIRANATQSPAGRYGLIVQTGGARGNGVQAAIAFTVPQLGWGQDSAMGAKPTLRSGYNTYRLVVHNTDYTFVINGQQAIQFKITDAHTGQRVGLWYDNVAIDVTSFKVFRLQAAHPLPALPPVKAINLRRPDVPAALSQHEGIYSTPEALSRIANVPVSTIVSRGLIIAYETVYQTGNIRTSGAWVIASTVKATASPQAARQQLARDWAADQAIASKRPHYAVGEPSGVGDEARQLSYEIGGPGFNDTWIDLYFTRGSYDISLSQGYHQGTVSRPEMINQTLALAKIMDQRAEQVK